MSYLDPPMGTGVTWQPDSNQIITRNSQLFSLADQGNAGLKVFLASVPSCNGISPELVQIWYILFTKIVATTVLYLHPYFCFRKHANSDYGFTCGFDTAPVPWPEFLAVAARLHVPANPATGQLEVLAISSSALIPEVLARPAVPEL